jgi:hypothetical protein
MDPTLQYLLLILGGCLGVYQLAAAVGGFKGLSFFRNPNFTFVVGFVILGVTYVLFFSFGDLEMNANDAAVVEGHEQLLLFFSGAFLALVATLLISSLVNFRGVNSDDEPVIGEGIEDLKGRTVLQAFAFRLKNRVKDK